MMSETSARASRLARWLGSLKRNGLTGRRAPPSTAEDAPGGVIGGRDAWAGGGIEGEVGAAGGAGGGAGRAEGAAGIGVGVSATGPVNGLGAGGGVGVTDAADVPGAAGGLLD